MSWLGYIPMSSWLKKYGCFFWGKVSKNNYLVIFVFFVFWVWSTFVPFFLLVRCSVRKHASYSQRGIVVCAPRSQLHRSWYKRIMWAQEFWAILGYIPRPPISQNTTLCFLFSCMLLHSFAWAWCLSESP